MFLDSDLKAPKIYKKTNKNGFKILNFNQNLSNNKRKKMTKK